MSLNNYLNENEQNKQIYILRYYLPCEPIYNEEVTAQRCDELIDYCVKNRIQAVMLYVDLNPYWYYLPDNIEHTQYYVKVVDSLGKRLRKVGVSYQLNYQNLFGAWDGGADLRYVNEWENYVDQYGNESWGVGCPLGEKFRKIAGAKLKMWAETKPDIIWIDDDIRMHNHRTAVHELYAGKTQNEELDFGCFCDEHMRQFNRRYGLSLSRKQLHQGILSGGDLRRKWLDFCRIGANDVAQWIEMTVKEVSEDTSVALMSSIPDSHSVEGRHWGEFLEKLSGDKEPIIRAHFGPYYEYNPHLFFECYNLIEQLKSNIKSQFKGNFEFCPEIENTRFSVWSKSLGATRFQLMLSAFLGCRGITLSIYDLEGGMLNEYPEFEELLQQARPFCDEMAKEKLWDAESLGVTLITSPDRAGETTFKKDASSMEELRFGRMWDNLLVKCGIPCRYATPEEIDSSKIYAIDEFTAELLRNDEIIKILSKSVILDAGAAKCLQERGFGKYLGIKVGEKLSCMAATEAFDVFKHSDGSEMRLPIRIVGNKWNEINLNGAVQMSCYVTPYGNEYTAAALFKNSLGGTALIFAGNGSMGDGFFSSYRIEWIKNTLSEISDNALPRINNKSYALFAVKETDKHYIAFVANMCADKIENLDVELPSSVAGGKIVDTYGNISDIDVTGSCIGLTDLNLGLYEAAVCILNKM